MGAEESYRASTVDIRQISNKEGCSSLLNYQKCSKSFQENGLHLLN